MYNIFRRIMCLRKISRGQNCVKYQCKRDISNINEIAYDELLGKVKAGAILIDVRTRQEFNEGHLDGAILIPYYEISRKINKTVYDKQQEIILYCKNGGRSLKAYETLEKMGYLNIYNLKEGIDGI